MDHETDLDVPSNKEMEKLEELSSSGDDEGFNTLFGELLKKYSKKGYNDGNAT